MPTLADRFTSRSRITKIAVKLASVLEGCGRCIGEHENIFTQTEEQLELVPGEYYHGVMPGARWSVTAEDEATICDYIHAAFETHASGYGYSQLGFIRALCVVLLTAYEDVGAQPRKLNFARMCIVLSLPARALDYHAMADFLTRRYLRAELLPPARKLSAIRTANSIAKNARLALKYFDRVTTFPRLPGLHDFLRAQLLDAPVAVHYTPAIERVHALFARIRELVISDPGVAIPLLLALFTGMRRSETHIHERADSVSWFVEGDVVTIRPKPDASTKNKKARSVCVDRHVMKWIGTQTAREWFVDLTRAGRQRLTKAALRELRKLGWNTHKPFHDLRRYAVTVIYHKKRLYDASILAGHQSLDVTHRSYILREFTPEHMAAWDALAASFAPAPRRPVKF